MRLSTVSSTGFAVLVVAQTLGLSAQAPPSQATPPSPAAAASAPTFKSGTALVLVDVIVTDAAGPIHGIPRSQFHLWEDGKEQKLVALEEHTPATPSTTPKQPQLPPNIYSNLPDAPPGSAVNVLLLDGLNTPMPDQAYVRQQMLAYLKNIPPGTRIAIFTLASRLRMAQGFTADPRPLVAALNSKKGLPTQSSLLTDASDTSMSDMSDDLADMGASGSAMSSIQQFEADTASFQTDLRVRYTLDALQDLARYLSAVPGRKNLIWFSGSFPLQIDPDATLPDSFQAMRNYADDVRETSRMLGASRVAVYPVDARGLLVDPQFNAQTSGKGIMSSGGGGGGSRRGSRGGGSGGGISSGQPKFAQNSMKFTQQTMAEHATMQEIAEETGGQASYNTNGLKDAVAQAIQHGSSYYTVAYDPADKAADGRFHKIVLKIPDAPSYRLAYRHGYVADSPKKQTPAPASATAAALLRGAPPFSEIIFKVRVLGYNDPSFAGVAPQPGPAGEVSPKVKGPLQRYAVDYAADMHAASLTETADGLHHASIEFLAIAYDRDGTRLNAVDKSFQFNLPPEKMAQVMQKGLPMHQEIDLPAGEVYLRAAVHDLNSDRIGSVEIPLLVKPTPAKTATPGSASPGP
jgi:VWFA-related protein